MQARRLYTLRDENGVGAVSRPAGLLRHPVLELGRRLGDRSDDPAHVLGVTAVLGAAGVLDPVRTGDRLRGDPLGGSVAFAAADPSPPPVA